MSTQPLVVQIFLRCENASDEKRSLVVTATVVRALVGRLLVVVYTLGSLGRGTIENVRIHLGWAARRNKALKD